MIHIYYGSGKGKTSAALGLSLRACGAGKRVMFISFLKDNSSCERLADCDVVFYRNPDKIPFLFNMTEAEKAEYAVWCTNALQDVFSSEYDVIVLDEFLDVLCLLDESIVKSLTFSSEREYIITGHTHNEYFFGIADYITEMKKEKHPYDKGVKARKGIEY